MNEHLINTIQEITSRAHTMGIYDYLFSKKNMSRTNIFKMFVTWAEDFEKTHKDFDWVQSSFYDEVDKYLSYTYKTLKQQDRIRDAFPHGIAVNDHISYNGGIYLITGFSERGILVKEVGGMLDSEWETTEIGFSQSDKVKIIPDYENVMDTTNGHNPKLVAKINIAWNKKREMFFPIMCALYKRDLEEIMGSDAFVFAGKLVIWTCDDAYNYLAKYWETEASNYLQHIADDTDLECILNYLHVQ